MGKDNVKKYEREKWILVIAMVIVAVYLIYSYNTGRLNSEFDMLSKLKADMKEVGYGEGLEFLTNSSNICIVEELTKTKDPVRKNIMNCGVNIASTAPKYGKNLSVYAIEDGICFSEKGKEGINLCYGEIKEKGCFVMYIKEGDTFETYDNMILIGINETFNENGCRIEG